MLSTIEGAGSAIRRRDSLSRDPFPVLLMRFLFTFPIDRVVVDRELAGGDQPPIVCESETLQRIWHMAKFLF